MSLTNLMNVEEISYTFFAETKPNSVEIDKPPTKREVSVNRAQKKWKIHTLKNNIFWFVPIATLAHYFITTKLHLAPTLVCKCCNC